MYIVKAPLCFTVGATGVEPETVIFGGWKLGRNRSASSTRRGHSGKLPQFVTFGESSCYTSLHGEKWMNVGVPVYPDYTKYRFGIIFSKIIIFSIWVYVLNPVFSVVFRMFLQQSFSLEQREATPLVNCRHHSGPWIRAWGLFGTGASVSADGGGAWWDPTCFVWEKHRGGGGWRKRSMSLKGNVGHLLQHWGAGNSYFFKSNKM